MIHIAPEVHHHPAVRRVAIADLKLILRRSNPNLVAKLVFQLDDVAFESTDRLTCLFEFTFQLLDARFCFAELFV